jgi:hypothetical protein
LIPVPKPRMSSGILRPPKRRITKTTRRTICHGPIAKKTKIADIRDYFKQM